MKDIYKENPLNPEQPKFCSQCGGKMILGNPKPAAASYDKETGKSTGAINYTAKCENITGFKLRRLLPTNYHDDLLVIDSPARYGITGKPHRTILTRGY